ncbi:FYVE and coiled-coil domain-containing protein 1 [Salmo trutta]|uniref:FYVE and coiled-coil domain-containing protein 1 n=1 Tax=Salmo trutta TaxID=8032 RepID=UPI0011325032|nr:FYVE and coiled-coil domain-containing protein 1-like [Salmo trutta]
MCNTTSVGENQLQRIIRDLHEAVTELSKEHRETGEPITDDSPNLHKLSYKLEYLLQFDQKEKADFLGSRKEYWDYFRECLAKTRGGNDGLRFVKAIPELKTSLGKGRAFLRYSLVHQRLADTLQQCLLNHKVTSEWYFARSPFLKSHLSSDIISHLYVLNEVQFDVASRGHDLDADWPTFARRTLGSNSAHLWKPPTHCSSVNSLVSYSGEFKAQEYGSSLLADLGEELGELGEELLGVPTPCTAADDLRIQVDRSELRQQELLHQSEARQAKLLQRVRELDQEAEELRDKVRELQGKLLAHNQEAVTANLNNMDLLSKLDSQEKARLEEERDSALQQTQVLQEEERDATLQQTQVLQEEEEREAALQQTQVLQEEERDATLQQTQVLQEEEERDAALQQTQVLQEEERDATLQQTQVLQEEEEREAALQQTQVLQEEEEREAALQQTQVLQEEEKDAALQQTQVLQEEEERDAALQQTQVLQEEEERNAALQQTQVLQEREEREEKGEVQDEKEGEERKEKREVQEEREGKERNEKREEQERKAMEKQLQELREQLRSRDRELTESREKIRQLEEENTDRLTGAGQEREKGEMDGEKEKLGTEKETAECSHSNLHKAGSAEGLSMEKNQHLSSKSEPQTQDLSPCPQTQDLSPCPQTLDLSPCPQTQDLSPCPQTLQLSQGEVLRLQREVVELRARLQLGAELQIRSQVERLNRQQVEVLLLAQEREEALGQEQHRKAQASQGLVLELASAREELHSLKTCYEGLALDHANRETAELGVHICRLTAQNEEARERWEALSARFQEELNTSMTSLQQENLGLQEQLLKEREEKGRLGEEEQGEVRAQKEAQQEEIQALLYQLSNQTINHQTQLQALSEELKAVRSEVEQEKKIYLKTKLDELESEKQGFHHLLEDNTSWIATSQKLIQQREEEMQHLTHKLARSEESLVVSQRSCEELREGLRKACQDKQSYELRTSAELDDLYRTKINLEERLIELIREKDALWQKSDALEFEQKLRAEEQTERDTCSNTSHCLSCSSPFSWWLHRHTCRLCGRGFCYYCCSNTVSLMEGGARERCCSVCYSQHSAVVERHPQEDTCTAPHTPFNPLPQPGRTMQPSNTDPAVPRADDAAYDIITEEEVIGVSNSHSLSFTTCSPHTKPQGAAEPNGGASTADTTPEDLHDQTGAVQDAEICLLRSGELTLCVPFSEEEISVFGDDLRELFIRSGCYSSIPITGSTPGASIHWLFTSHPKSISFSVLYREDTHTPLDEAKVLIPLTRCHSHKETMTGELMVRNTGEYTLIFDNSFSRFISKKVLYRLSVEQPVVYDGTH